MVSPPTTPSSLTLPAGHDAQGWLDRFLADLAVTRSANTVRAYRQDLARWLAFCRQEGVEPLAARPHSAIAFVRAERERPCGAGRTVGPRTVARRLAAIRQWYAYLALEPEATGVRRNPIPAGTAIRTGAGALAGRPALVRYDQPLPAVLSGDELARFLACLTATRYRDRAIVGLLLDGGLRIAEALALRLGDIRWATRCITLRAGKTRAERLVPLSAEALALLGTYLREERPAGLAHDAVFVNLGRRGFGQPFRYRSWVAVCEQARRAADTPRVHAHAFRHTCATNLAEGGMPLDSLQRLLGHRHLETVMVYNQVRDGRVAREYAAAMAARAAEGRGEERL